ncbi:MAG: hypothetical protein K2Y37_12050 [Pirellulales bacterium]|nr:hypothetical protein [Pirellulales bacterium]
MVHRCRVRSFVACAATVVVALPATARAGMPSVGLSEVAGMRLEAISFFLVGFLVSSLAIKWLWNWLAIDFAWLPRLSYLKACGLVGLWGLLFVIVLTMISGARELMTPGAWKKNGATYLLTSVDEPQGAAPGSAYERFDHLKQLSDRLRQFAAEHDGNFPATEAELTNLPEEWLVPNQGGLRYVYVTGRKPADGDVPLAYEPSIDGGKVLVATCAGDVVELPFDDVLKRLANRTSPQAE